MEQWSCCAEAQSSKARRANWRVDFSLHVYTTCSHKSTSVYSARSNRYLGGGVRSGSRLCRLSS